MRWVNLFCIQLKFERTISRSVTCAMYLIQVTKWCQGYQYAHLQTSAREDIGVAVAVQAIAKLALETKALREERLRSYSRSSASHRYVDFNAFLHGRCHKSLVVRRGRPEGVKYGHTHLI